MSEVVGPDNMPSQPVVDAIHKNFRSDLEYLKDLGSASSEPHAYVDGQAKDLSTSIIEGKLARNNTRFWSRFRQ